jgi:aspartate aminotransferase
MQTALDLAERISTISVSSTMAVSAEADRLRRAGGDVVDFGAGEPDFPTPENIKRAAYDAIEKNFTKYTHTAGIEELKQAIVERHKKDYGTDYSTKECVATVGGKHAIFNLMQALIDPGDEVIIPVPYWVTYKDVVNYAGARCVFVETEESEGFQIRASMVERALTPKTKMIVINSPSNPSGAVFARAELERIAQIARDRGVWVMTDECYHRFLYSGDPYSMAAFPGMKETVIVAGSLSKTYAMTGWRVGFVLAPAAVTGAVVKLQSHSTSNVNSIAQKAAIEALRGPQESVTIMLAEYKKRRDYVVARLRQMPGVHANMPDGAFYAYPNVSAAFTGGIANSLQFAEKLLAEELVAVVPGEAFGTRDHVRISYATSLKELERGMDRMHKFIAARV